MNPERLRLLLGPVHSQGRARRGDRSSTKLICDVIRDGAYDHVAAGSAGISYRTHLRWLELGRADDAPEPCASYYREVSAARNQVRAAVEAEVRKANPLAWLKCGPGRDRPSQPGPGWADANQAEAEVPQVSFRALQIEAYIQNRERLEKEAQQLPEPRSDDDDSDNSDRYLWCWAGHQQKLFSGSGKPSQFQTGEAEVLLHLGKEHFDLLAQAS